MIKETEFGLKTQNTGSLRGFADQVILPWGISTVLPMALHLISVQPMAIIPWQSAGRAEPLVVE